MPCGSFLEPAAGLAEVSQKTHVINNYHKTGGELQRKHFPDSSSGGVWNVYSTRDWLAPSKAAQGHHRSDKAETQWRNSGPFSLLDLLLYPRSRKKRQTFIFVSIMPEFPEDNSTGFLTQIRCTKQFIESSLVTEAWSQLPLFHDCSLYRWKQQPCCTYVFDTGASLTQDPLMPYCITALNY